MKRLLSSVLIGCLLPFALCAQSVQGTSRALLQVGKAPFQVNPQLMHNLSQALDPHTQNVARELPSVSEVPNYVRGTLRVDSKLLQDILLHKTYISALDIEEAKDLAYYFAFADAQVDLVDVLFRLMEKTPLENEQLLSFYTMAAASLGHNCQFRTRGTRLSAQDRAIQEVKKASQDRLNTGKHAIWPATVLWMLAADASEEDWPCVMDTEQRQLLERKLKTIIGQFNWLKDFETDYVMTGVKKKKLWHPSNQTTMISLFEQSHSFFASQDDDSIAKGLITTGGFNTLIRYKETGDMETAMQLRFSNDGEVFYFNHPTPGTDGKGHYVDSPNGYRHQVLSLLIEALCVSYATRSGQEASRLIEAFTRSYFTTDSNDKFTHYLYVPLIAMRSGRELLEYASLEGWQANEQALQGELYAKIKKGYKAAVVCSTIQGACEVAAEWTGIGILFEVAGLGVKTTLKIARKGLMKVLPIPAMLGIATAELGARQAIRFSNQGIKHFLSAHGWKLAAAGAVGVGMQSDMPRKKVVR